jgi:hypothetical protein
VLMRKGGAGDALAGPGRLPSNPAQNDAEGGGSKALRDQRRLRRLRARRPVARCVSREARGQAPLRSMTRKLTRMLPPHSVNVAMVMSTRKLKGSMGLLSRFAVTAQEMGASRRPWITRKGEIDPGEPLGRRPPQGKLGRAAHSKA